MVVFLFGDNIDLFIFIIVKFGFGVLDIVFVLIYWNLDIDGIGVYFDVEVIFVLL